MAKKIPCHCGGRASCALCHGTGAYEYEPGPRGWLPFRCPTCEGRGRITEPGLEPTPCPTCRGGGTVDPADPPTKGMLDVVWKALFGA